MGGNYVCKNFVSKGLIFYFGAFFYSKRGISLKIGCISKTFGDNKFILRGKTKKWGIIKKFRVTIVEKKGQN